MQLNTENSITFYDSYNQALNQQNSLSNNSSISNYASGCYDTYHNQYGYGYNSFANFSYYPAYQQYQGSPNHTITSQYCINNQSIQPVSSHQMTQPNQISTPNQEKPVSLASKPDWTPEKPIMNDSGVELISPQISLHTSASNITNSTSISASPNSEGSSEFSSSAYSAANQNNIVSKQLENNSIFNESEKQKLADQSAHSDEDEDANESISKENNNKGQNDGLPIKPPKPYLEIIADAILSCEVKMMQLHEIYAFMEAKYKYFAMNVNKSWRNSVRHNLSLNECFIKAARGTNGKGNYWRIHPLCQREFIRGNFRRKTFKQLIRTGTQQPRHPMSLVHGYQGFTSLPVEYSSFNGNSFTAMFPPPLPSSLIHSCGKIDSDTHNNSQRYLSY